ncbi:MAG TPA: S41 family peptidase [bacterium]|nr:S41 family peptidase [bacterium]
MRKSSLIFGFSILFFICFQLGAEEASIIRRPAFSPDGKTLAFSWQGDIWTIPEQGGRAIRLTIHEAYETNPVWSPNGESIAFNGNRFGNHDIYTMTAQGSNIKRLTYHSSQDNLFDWTVNDRVLFTTSRNFQQVEWNHEIATCPVSGSTPYRLLNAVGEMPAMSPDGRYIAFVKGACRVAREKYRGAANKDIWIYDIENDQYTQITSYNGQDYLPKWKDSKSLYFISARSGKYNLYSINIKDTSRINKITDFDEFGVRHFDNAENSDKLVFSRKNGLFTIDSQGQNISKVKVEVSKDNRFDNRVFKTYSDQVSDFAISPNGNLNAFVIRGDIFVTRNDNEDEYTVNITKSSSRETDPVWLNDSTLIYLSDKDNQYDIYLAKPDNENETQILKSLQIRELQITNTDKNESNIMLSPDREKIAFVRGLGDLIVADIAADGKLDNLRTLRKGWAEPQGLSWSPDSRWLAYSVENLNFNNEVFIQNIDDGQPINVSMHPRGDYAPSWSRSGDKLAFVSERNNQNNDVWFVWLKEEDWLKTERERKEEKFEQENNQNSEDEDKQNIEKIRIDTDEIYKRIEQVTDFSGNESMPLFSKDGEKIYFIAESKQSSGRDIFSIKWNGEDLDQITKGGRNPRKILASPEGNSIFMLNRTVLNQINLDNNDVEPIAFEAEMEVNYKKEIQQIFEEGWRTIYNGFYDPDFHGRDWKKLKNKYKNLALKASTKEDMAYMFNLMLGQLNASHMGLYSSGRYETQNITTGKLGIEIVPVENGVKIERVIPQTPADRPKSHLNAGDVIAAVNGKSINKNTNFYSLFNNKAGKKVLLTVQNEERSQNVYIWPQKSISNQLYKEWVNEKLRLTHQLSDGQLGYLHIRGMNWTSFEQFERDLAAAGYGKEGIVIDVRFNGGGWTTDYLMAILNVKQHAYTIPRGATDNLEQNHENFRQHYPFSVRLPFYPWTKPSIALCNSNSYSNAEIFSHAYKTLNIGTLVGKPTFGAVISTGGKRLIDGSYIRLPYRAWYVKKTDHNMEHEPAVPDIIVDNPPGSKANNRDPQLKKAVDELLKEIKNRDN